MLPSSVRYIEKSLAKYFILLLCLFLLQSCALQKYKGKNLNTIVNQLVEENEFGEALYIIDNIKPTDKQYKKVVHKKKKIITKRDEYIAAKKQKINVLINDGKWDKANTVYLETLSKLSKTNSLNKEYDTFQKRREQHLRFVSYQLQINNAEKILKDRIVQQEIINIDPDKNQDSRQYKKYQRDLTLSYEELVECGLDALENKAYELAEQCLMLAEELIPNEALQVTILDIQKQMGKNKNKNINISKKGQKLLDLAQNSLTKLDLKQSYNYYQQIPNKDKGSNKVKQFKNKLDTAIDTKVEQGIQMGRRFYRQGEVKRALAIWYEIKELVPNNEKVLNYINRAEGVIKKLDAIENDPEAIKIPAKK